MSEKKQVLNEKKESIKRFLNLAGVYNISESFQKQLSEEYDEFGSEEGTEEDVPMAPEEEGEIEPAPELDIDAESDGPAELKTPEQLQQVASNVAQQILDVLDKNVPGFDAEYEVEEEGPTPEQGEEESMDSIEDEVEMGEPMDMEPQDDDEIPPKQLAENSSTLAFTDYLIKEVIKRIEKRKSMKTK